MDYTRNELAALSELSLLVESLSDGQFGCLQSLAALLRVPGNVLEGFIGGFPLFILHTVSVCPGLSGAVSPLVGARRGQRMDKKEFLSLKGITAIQSRWLLRRFPRLVLHVLGGSPVPEELYPRRLPGGAQPFPACRGMLPRDAPGGACPGHRPRLVPAGAAPLPAAGGPWRHRSG